MPSTILVDWAKMKPQSSSTSGSCQSTMSPDEHWMHRIDTNIRTEQRHALEEDGAAYIPRTMRIFISVVNGATAHILEQNITAVIIPLQETRYSF